MVRRWVTGDSTAPRPDPDATSCALASGGLLHKNDRSSCVEAGCASAATANRISATARTARAQDETLDMSTELHV